MYQAPKEASSAKMCGAFCGFLLGAVLLVIGLMLVFIIGGSDKGILTAGYVCIGLSAFLLMVGTYSVMSIRKDLASTDETPVTHNMPLVSGSAPPGPVGGFHITQQQQQHQHQGLLQPQGQIIEPSAPPPSYAVVTGSYGN